MNDVIIVMIDELYFVEENSSLYSLDEITIIIMMYKVMKDSWHSFGLRASVA